MNIMKKLITILFIASGFMAFGQQYAVNVSNNNFDETAFASDTFSDNLKITGTMMQKGDEWFIQGVETRSEEVTDYYPSNLEREFMVDGLRVVVEATLDPIPDGVRLAGKPITIIKIEKI